MPDDPLHLIGKQVGSSLNVPQTGVAPVLQIDPLAKAIAAGPGAPKIPELTPAGNPMPRLSELLPESAGQLVANAYRQGSNHYHLGHPETANPFPKDTELYREYARGYTIARKDDRFNATIRKRREAKKQQSQ